jgi:hypothetical protein
MGAGRWGRARASIAPCAVLLAAAILFWPLPVNRQHLVPFHAFVGDPCLAGLDPAADRPGLGLFDTSPVTMFYAQKSLAALSLRLGDLPLWNPFSAVGVPLLANGQSQPYAPFFLPFLLVPNPWVYTLCLMLQLLFGAVGAALFLRRLGGGSWTQALAGILFAFNPYALNYSVYSDVWAYVWFPWVFAEAESWAQGRRRPWLLASLLALMAAGGHLEVAFLGAVSSFAYLAVRMGQERLWRKDVASWLALPAAAASLSALWLVPFAEYWANVTSPRFSGSPCFPYHPSACFVVGGELLWPPVLIALAALGWLSPPARKVRWALLPGSIWALLVMFPSPALLQRVLTGDFMSGRYARSLAWFALAVMATLGAEALGRAPLTLKTARVAAACAAVAFAASLAVGQPSLSECEARHWVPLQGPPFAHHWGLVAGSALAVLLLFLPRHWLAPRLRGIGTATLLLASLLPFHSAFDVYWNRSDPRPAPAVAQAAPSGRLWFSDGSFPPNLGACFGIADVRLADPFVPVRLAGVPWPGSAGQSLFRTWNAPMARFLAVDGAVQRLAPGAQGPSAGFRIRRDPAGIPKGFWVSEEERAATAREALLLALEGDRWRRAAVLEGVPSRSLGAVKPEARGFATLVDESPARQRWRTAADADGLLVVRDLFWPGWRVQVDGQKAEILPADGVFRAVRLPSGAHEVVFRYVPASFLLGGCVTLVTALVAGAAGLRRRRELHAARQRPPASSMPAEESHE